MSIDITNHLIPYTQVKRMLANAWDQGQADERDYTQTVEDEFESCLKVVDLAVIRVGAFYVVELSKLADRVCTEADRIEKEGIGE